MKKRLYYKDSYGNCPEGYVLATELEPNVYVINRGAYIRANSRCKNGCYFMGDDINVYINGINGSSIQELIQGRVK